MRIYANFILSLSACLAIYAIGISSSSYSQRLINYDRVYSGSNLSTGSN